MIPSIYYFLLLIHFVFLLRPSFSPKRKLVEWKSNFLILYWTSRGLLVLCEPRYCVFIWKKLHFLEGGKSFLWTKLHLLSFNEPCKNSSLVLLGQAIWRFWLAPDRDRLEEQHFILSEIIFDFFCHYLIKLYHTVQPCSFLCFFK